MVLIYQGPIDVDQLLSRWYNAEHNRNYGAMVSFVGTVREYLSSST